MKVLLGVTGSVAAVYTTKLYKALLADKHEVKIIVTDSAGYFYDDGLKVVKDDDENWELLTNRDTILHIELRKWADVMVIAPLSANSMAKIVCGLCDNLLTNTVRAWDYSKPLILCPAMNTMMWENPPTANHIVTLKDRGCVILNPVSKKLACGDLGIGAMCHHSTIIDELSNVWKYPLRKVKYIPEGEHLGAFGARRKYDTHTGVDLYCKDNAIVYAVEDGYVEDFGPFTGPEVSMPWWESTHYLSVRGKSGVVLYGEIHQTQFGYMDKITRGQKLGRVKAVLSPDKVRSDIPNHSNAMLHLELLKPSDHIKWAAWGLKSDKPHYLLNPTSRLKTSK